MQIDTCTCLLEPKVTKTWKKQISINANHFGLIFSRSAACRLKLRCQG